MRVETFLRRNYQFRHIIVIPHYDDEIIGCYQLFVDAVSKPNKEDSDSIVIMPVFCGEPGTVVSDEHRRQESLKAVAYFTSVLGKDTNNIGICAPISLSALYSSILSSIRGMGRSSAGCSSTRLNCIWFPDPLYEKHPEHILIGNFGPLMSSVIAQNNTVPNDVLFGYYSINMQAPYVQPLSWKEADGKAKVCEIFTSQAGYFASHGEAARFEGRRLA